MPNDWSMRNYGHNPYTGYDGRAGPYPLYRGDLPAELEPMARVVVVRRGWRRPPQPSRSPICGRPALWKLLT